MTAEIVRQAWQTFSTRDRDRIAAVFTPDAEWLAPAGNATARALDITHHMIGREQIADFLAVDFPRLFTSDIAITFRGFHTAGDTVIVEETMTATLADGSHYANDYCLVFEVHNGLIRRVREYLDTARGASQLHAVAPLPK
ncbi:nuclear transport factor 2 family protein [Crossiella sp. CA198]|uniref:nuclear transport factor 2 family protein n=1 Tax=Crossiella sp. CA198 TaxID=3455607 RepID=UPI003F8D0D7F